MYLVSYQGAFTLSLLECVCRNGGDMGCGPGADCFVVEESVPTVTVRLWRADAVVLYDWLATTDLNSVPISHPAQKQALADLLSRFEWAADSDVTESTPDEIAAAQEDVARSLGW